MIRTREKRTEQFRKPVEKEWKEKFKNIFESNPDKPWEIMKNVLEDRIVNS
tara:strand:- start:351 stop:503 length:153 start_codon:yes stop_codon:yes gene_type:complete